MEGGDDIEAQGIPVPLRAPEKQARSSYDSFLEFVYSGDTTIVEGIAKGADVRFAEAPVGQFPSTDKKRKKNKRFTIRDSIRMDELKRLQNELTILIQDDDNDDDVILTSSDGRSRQSMDRVVELLTQSSSERTSEDNDTASSYFLTEASNTSEDNDTAEEDVEEVLGSPTTSSTGSIKLKESSVGTRRRRVVNGSTMDTLSRHVPKKIKNKTDDYKTTEDGHSMQRRVSYMFLEKEEEKYESGMLPKTEWWHGFFFFSFVGFVACIITLWAPYPIGARQPTADVAKTPWSDGCKQGLASCICPRETICADTISSEIFLTIARCSAWADYPLYMVLFLSKADNLNNFLQTTSLRVFVNFSDYHHVHQLFGFIVGIETASHTFFHLLRWASSGTIQLLWQTRTGITGLIAFIAGLFIIVPMSVPAVKTRMKFEWRKGLHYLFVVWALCLCFHAPQRIFWLIGVPFGIYLLDNLAEMFFKTYLIENVYFERLSDTSCLLTFDNPWDKDKNAAYVYIMLPWLSKVQNHAFTMFPGSEPNTSQICISSVKKEGEWTTELLKKIVTPAHRPAFITGPYLSPFSSPAMDCENLVVIGSGIGITPAISIFRQYISTKRRVNLVWMCKDAGLVEHFVGTTLNHLGGLGYILIYYTGTRPIVLDKDLPANMLIFHGRPNLEKTISGIVYSIASGNGLPEELAKNRDVLSNAPAADTRCKLLIEKALDLYSIDQLFQYAVKASGPKHKNPWAASYKGIKYICERVLGDVVDMERVVHGLVELDSDGSGEISRHQFELFLGNLKESNKDAPGLENIRQSSTVDDRTQNLFDGTIRRKDRSLDTFSSRSLYQNIDAAARKYLHHDVKDGKFAAKNWSMLYCGGSQVLLDQMKDIKHKLGIGLSVEKFDW